MATTLQTFIEQTTEKQTDQRIRNGAAYHSLLTDLANDIAVDDVELSLVLEMVGKTTGQLADDVKEMRKRIERYREIQRRDQLQTRSAEIEVEMAKLQSEFDRVGRPLLIRIEELNLEHKRATENIHAMRLTIGFQESGCMNLALLETEKALRQKVSEVTKQLDPIKKELLWQQNKAGSNTFSIPIRGDDQEIANRRRADAIARIKVLEKQIKPLENEIREIGIQLNQIQAEKLKP